MKTLRSVALRWLPRPETGNKNSSLCTRRHESVLTLETLLVGALYVALRLFLIASFRMRYCCATLPFLQSAAYTRPHPFSPLRVRGPTRQRLTGGRLGASCTKCCRARCRSATRPTSRSTRYTPTLPKRSCGLEKGLPRGQGAC